MCLEALVLQLLEHYLGEVVLADLNLLKSLIATDRACLDLQCHQGAVSTQASYPSVRTCSSSCMASH